LTILYNESFVKELTDIWDFISLDSKNRANAFTTKIKQKIEDIPSSPYMNRKSIYFDNNEIRDMIHKGYIIVYKINQTHQSITVIGINKYKQTILNLAP